MIGSLVKLLRAEGPQRRGRLAARLRVEEPVARATLKALASAGVTAKAGRRWHLALERGQDR